MTTFDNREKAAESMFAREAEDEFRARARRDRLVGLWASAKLGLSDAEATTYANNLLTTDVTGHGDSDVIALVKKDFAEKGLSVTDAEIAQVMADKMLEAQALMKAGH